MRRALATVLGAVALMAAAVGVAPSAYADGNQGDKGDTVNVAANAHPSPELTDSPAPDDPLTAVLTDTEVSVPDLAGAGVGTHILYAKVYGDEEYRNLWGTRWKASANSDLETADNSMGSNFGIDIRNTGFFNFTSAATATNSCTALTDFKSKSNYTGADMAWGFGYNFTGGSRGCAYAGGNWALLQYINQTNDWRTAQHETSHIFSAQDRYIKYNCDNASHPDDVMECPYTVPNSWTTDFSIMMSHRGRFR